MIGSRAILQASRCSNCRKKVLDTFMFTGEGRFPGTDAIHRSRQIFPKPLQKRSLTHQPRILSQQIPADALETEPAAGDNQGLEGENIYQKDEASQKEFEVPWYLQMEAPQSEQQSSPVRLKTPDLPVDPPPLLQPILDHILYDLGLDDLRLLDLRKLDPPPALGANLLMVIGTARSEKHLHVSADRFRRWIRTTHQKRALADGLIGRGELKLRLRRKARRARIMSRVGSSEVVSADDGLRTGWVCVTIDDVEDGRTDSALLALPDDYVGFGDVTGGVRIVIQMLTREKREELDLEALWGNILWRHGQKEAKIVAAEAELAEASKVGPNSAYSRQPPSDLIPNPSPLAPYPIQINQIRRMHNLSSSQTGSVSHLPGVQDYEDPNRGLSPTDQGLDHAAEDDELFEFLRSTSEDDQGDAEGLTEKDPTVIRLRKHLEYVKSLPLENALAALGEHGLDAASTPFLKSFLHPLPLFPSAEHWKYHVSLACYGLEIGAPGYDKACLSRVFNEMQKYVIDIPTDLYLLVMKLALTPSLKDISSSRPVISSESLRWAAELLVDMSFRGHDIVTEEIRMLFEIGILRAAAAAATTESSEELDVAAPRRIRQVLEETFKSFPSLEIEIQKLQLCADLGYWQGFWDIWGDFPIQLRSRPKELYYAALQIFADKGHQANTMDAIRIIVPEMDREEPPVPLEGDIVDALLGCLRVIEPDIDDIASQDWVSNDEHLKLWRRCEMVKQEENRFLREYDDD